MIVFNEDTIHEVVNNQKHRDVAATLYGMALYRGGSPLDQPPSRSSWTWTGV